MRKQLATLAFTASKDRHIGLPLLLASLFLVSCGEHTWEDIFGLSSSSGEEEEYGDSSSSGNGSSSAGGGNSSSIGGSSSSVGGSSSSGIGGSSSSAGGGSSSNDGGVSGMDFLESVSPGITRYYAVPAGSMPTDLNRFPRVKQWLANHEQAKAEGRNYSQSVSSSLYEKYGEHAQLHTPRFRWELKNLAERLLRNDPMFAEVMEFAMQLSEEIEYDWVDYGYNGQVQRTPGKRYRICDGYAKEVMAKVLSLNSVQSVQRRGSTGHAWNVLTLTDGRTLYFDLTWFDNESIDRETGIITQLDDYGWTNITFYEELFRFSGVGYGTNKFEHSLVKSAIQSRIKIYEENVRSGDPVVYEGETYPTVILGSQTWFAKNLNTWLSKNSNIAGKCYNDDPANCEKYGSLYDWVTAMNLPSDCNTSVCSSQIQIKHRGICPAGGWHIPNEADWDTSSYASVKLSVVGEFLKSNENISKYFTFCYYMRRR